MSENSRLLNFIITILFGGSVVALGAHELRDEFMSTSSSEKSEKLVQELLGDPSFMLSKKSAAPKKGARRILPQDDIDNEDKQGLEDLLNKVLP